MKRIFRRKSRSNSTSHTDIKSFPRRLSLPAPDEVEVLHSMNDATEEDRPEDADVRSFLDEESVALSEAETLAQPKSHRWDLQETYAENYTEYLPFLINRLRAQQLEELQEGYTRGLSPTATGDDDATIISLRASEEYVFGRPPSVWNLKRSLIVGREFIKGTMYVFPDMVSFEKFRYLRSHQKKLSKNSYIVYDAEGNIKRIKGKPPSEEGMASFAESGSLVDQRQHIIPVDYKLKGDGLPIFKISSPYMSSFRKKVPFMVFRKYRQVPLRPKLGDKEDEDENFELYVFCTVHVKNHTYYRRFILHFTPEDGPPLKLLMFQNNHIPFADFTYKGTRFRVSGTALTNPYLMSYNAELKLLILSGNQPSLCDCVIDKLKQDTYKKRDLSEGLLESEASLVPEELNNPIPHPRNPILTDEDGPLLRLSIRKYILNKRPPFARLIDACAYMDDSPLIPKKYTEVAKVELYQDNSHMDPRANLSVPSSVDYDSLVLATVLMTLQETKTRNTSRYTSNKYMGGVNGRAYIAGGGFAGARAYEAARLGSFSMNAL